MEKDDILTASLNEHFVFLLKEKYRFSSIKHTGPMGCWEIELESDSSDVIFKLMSDRNEIFLVMANRREKFWVSLTVIIFFITKKIISSPSDDLKNWDDTNRQLSYISTVLKDYIEQIMVIFGKDSRLYKDELMISMNNFRTIQADAIKKKNSPIVK